MSYRLVPGPFFTPPRFALAPRRSTIEGAIDDMGTGMVVDGTGRLVAFHESHLDVVTRLAEIRSN